MSEMKFEKWHGLGNDFIIVKIDSTSLSDKQVAKICDRNFGIGADGILFVECEDHSKPRMIIRNADGSRPEMCGNGLRCVAAYLKSNGNPEKLTIVTDAGERNCFAEDGVNENVFDVTIDMGISKQEDSILVEWQGREFSFYRINMGNPHTLTFESFSEIEMNELGSVLSKTGIEGTNVEFCSWKEGELHVIVWERGVGRTLACGTGACAAAALSCKIGKSLYDHSMRVWLPGGPLSILISEKNHRVLMKGPAEKVFSGTMLVE